MFVEHDVYSWGGYIAFSYLCSRDNMGNISARESKQSDTDKQRH